MKRKHSEEADSDDVGRVDIGRGSGGGGRGRGRIDTGRGRRGGGRGRGSNRFRGKGGGARGRGAYKPINDMQDGYRGGGRGYRGGTRGRTDRREHAKTMMKYDDEFYRKDQSFVINYYCTK